jgi:hypothetical protein
LDVGYLNLDVTLESSILVGLELPSGLKFYPQTLGSRIQGSASLGTDSSINSKVQRIANLFLNGESSPSYVGISGLLLQLNL